MGCRIGKELRDTARFGRGGQSDQDRSQQQSCVLDVRHERRCTHTRKQEEEQSKRSADENRHRRVDGDAKSAQCDLEAGKLQLPPGNEEDYRGNRDCQFQPARPKVPPCHIGQRHRVIPLACPPEIGRKEVSDRVGKQDVSDEPDAVACPVGVHTPGKSNERADAVGLTCSQDENQHGTERPPAH